MASSTQNKERSLDFIGEDCDEDSDEDSDEEYSGMRLPTLLKQLQTILREYPDGGQIIKEIVQNADDAGATEMKICFESCHIKPDPENRRSKYFVAPALCFYNNAVFNERDWKGIRAIYMSVKEEDPLKVGRFGLGFKSVFHISDFPTIISGDRLLVIDPLQRNPNHVCWTRKLKKASDIRLILSTIIGKFGFTEQSLTSGIFSGTIIWLPLRSTFSRLSNNVYNEAKVDDLFQSFKTEAPITLLFLKSLQKIEWYNGQNIQYSVQVKDTDGQILKQKANFQKMIKDKTEEAGDKVIDLKMSIQTELHADGGCEEDITKWLVVNLLSSKSGLSETMLELMKDKSLSYPPYVSIAMPLEMNTSEFKGHVFCFLPLPLESRSLTGFPVHVNGFFALSQSRRHVKWSSADEKTNSCVAWNECLVMELLPRIYKLVLEKLISDSEHNGNTKEWVSLVYRSIPDKKFVQANWDLLLEPLYSAIVMETFLFTENKHSNNCWLNCTNCIFPPDPSVEETTWKVIRHVYLEASENLVEVPEHISAILKKYAPAKMKSISPDHMRGVLWESGPMYRGLSVSEKLYILNFLLSDGQYGRLAGLELLPLDNKDFVTFEKREIPVGNTCENCVFYCTSEEHKLFPGLDDRIVMLDAAVYEIPGNLLQSIRNHLSNIALEEIYQLQQLKQEMVPQLIELTVQANSEKNVTSDRDVWNIDDTTKLNESWLDHVWEYLSCHFKDLKPLDEVPLIPVQNRKLSGGRGLIKPSERMIVQETRGTDSLSDLLCEALEYLGVLVLPVLSDSVLAHPGLLGTVVMSPSIHGFVQSIAGCSDTDVLKFNAKSTRQHRAAVIDYLHGTSELPNAAVCTLRKLKLFRSTIHPEITKSDVSVEECNQIVPDPNLPFKFPRQLLILDSSADQQLTSLLGCTTVPIKNLVTQVVQTISQSERLDRTHYSLQDVEDFMVYFVSNIEEFDDLKETMELARNVAFLGDNPAIVSCFYDPTDLLLQELFLQEPRFPPKPFDSDNFVRGLRKLGLRSSDLNKTNHIRVEDILETAQWLNQSSEDGVMEMSWKRKSIALFTVLEKFPHFLKESLLLENLKQLKWITPAKRHEGYPPVLPWHDSNLNCYPADVCSEQYYPVVGSVMAVVTTISTEMLSAFGWEQAPPIDMVLKQLEIVSEKYQSHYKPQLFETICLIYEHLSSRLEEITEENQRKLCESNCVWFGDGFCKPQCIYVDQFSSDVDLKPYLFPRPEELLDFSAFLRKLGCYTSQTTDALLYVQELMRLKLVTGSCEENPKRDLQITIQILNKLKDNPELTIDRRVLFPICTSNDSKLVLKPAGDCTYCDQGWLEGLTDDDDSVILVHSDVPNGTAQALGVKSLMQNMFSDTEGIQEWGQHEPLTTRLHSLLEGYSDGFSVLKEIVQNADDAGASQVCFLYDERENEHYQSCLIDPAMTECQGPAFWAYNDAQFTDQDFENITKLCGASKQMDNTKIGKFGLGFSAVYNLTDVPSIVSRNNLVIFDPHMKYLGKLIMGKQPGLKIDLRTMKNKAMLKKMRNQFGPYGGVFGCDVMTSDKSNFSGTLFRYPLRTENQAVTSKISKKVYNKEEMKSLLNIFMKSAGNLLLFTQYVGNIKLYHLDADSKYPQDAVLLYEARRDILEEIPQTLSQNTSITQYVSSLIREQGNSLHSLEFKMCQILKIQIRVPLTTDVCNLDPCCNDSHWMTSWALGTEQSLNLALKTEITALPIASVAVLMVQNGDKFLPCQLEKAPIGFYKEGHTFCFLPLPIKTSLPMHINAYFAITSDRCQLCSQNEDAKESIGYQWNQSLLMDAVPKAYLHLINKLQDINLSEDYIYHQLWPTSCDTYFMNIQEQFFTTITNDELAVFHKEGLWKSLSNCLIFQMVPNTDDDVNCIAFSSLSKIYREKGWIVLNIPPVIKDCFTKFSCRQKMEQNTVTLKWFYEEKFLQDPSSTMWSTEERNRLVLFALDNASFCHLLKNHKCIPCEPNGQLRVPHELVDPHSSLASLFSEEDGRFPVANRETFRKPERLQILKSLGLMESSIPADLVIEQAQTVGILANTDSDKALKKCIALLNYLGRENNQNISQKLTNIKFMPVMLKPSSWPLCWKAGSAGQEQNTVWASPQSLFSSELKHLVGSQCLVVDNLSLEMNEERKHELFDRIGIQRTLDCSLDIVLNHLKAVSQIDCKNLKDDEESSVLELCKQIYQYLDRTCSQFPSISTKVTSTLSDIQCVWTEQGFCLPSMVIISHKSTDIDLSPYLCTLPNQWKKFSDLFMKLGCQQNQNISSLFDAMRNIQQISEKETYHSQGDVERDLLILIQILNKLKLKCDDIGHETIFFPTNLTTKSRLVVKPASECAYCDAGWLQDLTEEDFVMIHPDIPNSTAEALGVQSLTQMLLSDTEGIKDWGQSEPLTRRLNSVLKGYPDGLSVPKEIVQNADDARAKEVCFMYDERENDELKTCLIDKEMAQCQGPALWAYNDAEFSDADFENVTKLGGATKEMDRTKIGRFGLGFCALYNLTDAPSIVSGNTIVIFDPHMKYLGKAIQGRQPGIKINLSLVKNKLMLRKMKNQFEPYNCVFDCSISGENQATFPGTLFRLPLRTQEQARESQISDKVYNKQEVKKLLEKFMESAGNLLLFSQHVHTIKVYHLSPFEKDPRKALLLMEIRKTEIERIPRGVLVAEDRTAMELAAELVEKVKNLPKSENLIPHFKTCSHLKIKMKYEAGNDGLIDVPLRDSETHWMVSWSTGTKKSLTMAIENNKTGFLTLGSVAVLLQQESDALMPCDLLKSPDGFYKQGHIFCFLPLPVTTPLPLHINGCFAVNSDRKTLLYETEDDKNRQQSHDWNTAIMADAVCNAYIFLLERLQELNGLDPDYMYHQFWPTEFRSTECEILCKQLYYNISHESPEVFYSNGHWKALENSIFLDPAFRSMAHVGEAAYNCLLNFKQSEHLIVLDLPEEILTAFKKADCGDRIQERIVSVENFFEGIFFPSFSSRYWDHLKSQQNLLTIFALDQTENVYLKEILRKHKCIPCRPNGLMRYPNEIVRPYSAVASLFSESDERFPCDNGESSFCKPQRLQVLQTLGMMCDSISVDLLIDRAKSVIVLNQEDSKKASNRCNSVLKYIEQMKTHDNVHLTEIKDRLSHVPFLPVKRKPRGWPIQWHADDIIKSSNCAEGMLILTSADNLCVETAMYLVGAQSFILDELPFSSLFSDVFLKILGVTSNEAVSIENVLEQLLEISKFTCDQVAEHRCIVHKICTCIYQYLDKLCSENKAEVNEKWLLDLKNQPVLLLGGQFVEPSRIAQQKLHCDCEPELFCVAEKFSVQYHTHFLEAIGVRQSFNSDDINNVLKKKKLEFGNDSLPDVQLSLVINLINSLAALVEQTHSFPSHPIYMPDSFSVLWDVKDLCRDDIEFQLDRKNLKIVHNKIAHDTATTLGVQTLRGQHIKQYTLGLPFGQSEKLTSRLKGILSAYPCGGEIMKELLQNADDAGATKLCFLKDFQEHPCDRVFGDKWITLQGPALCVYNNSSFKKSDLEGIQKLGEGSKQDDPTKTGQYGIGFNAVYHLTDVPSFLTKGEAVDGGETLCVLDPHCSYVPGATEQSPGAQYKHLVDLRQNYPDVFYCYPEQVFENEDSGTLFRFPLRNEQMAEKSRIKNHPISKKQITDLIETFKTEMMETLLFVNNLTSIEVCSISNDKVETEYRVTATLSEDNKMRRQEFFSYMKSMAKKVKDSNSKLDFRDIEKKQVTYQVSLCDSRGVTQTWCVVQQFGFCNSEEIPEEVIEAMRTGDLGLLPRGGIAILLPKFSEGRIKLNEATSVSSGDRPSWKPHGLEKVNPSDVRSREQSHDFSTPLSGKAFCFLPLPQTTGLPVHVNGHFSLDHDSRRHLWKDNPQSYRTLWNKVLMENVISDCYVSGLQFLKSLLFQENQSGLKDGEFEIFNRVNFYHAAFPVFRKDGDEYWKNLTAALYQQIDGSRRCFFPIIQHWNKADQIENEDVTSRTQWVPLKPVDNGTFPAFFNDIKGHISHQVKPALYSYERQRVMAGNIKQILKALGMKLIDSPMWIRKSIKQSGVEAHRLEACHVRDFLKSFNQHSSVDHCKLKSVDVPLITTVFQNTSQVIEILDYCNLDGELLEHLDGLPLLVTLDENLRVFNKHKPVFSSQFYHLVKATSKNLDLFLNHNMVFWAEQLDSQYKVFRKFTVKAFANLLPSLLDESNYKSYNSVSWKPDVFPNREWIACVWSFFLDNLTEAGGEENIEMSLDLLEDWCLLPAHRQSGNILVPVSDSKLVLSTILLELYSLEFLQKFELPEIDTEFAEEIKELFFTMVAQPENPQEILYCLWKHNNLIIPSKVLFHEVDSILKYFNDRLEKMCRVVPRDTLVQRLKSLPFYQTHGGSLTKLESTPAVVVPSEMPQEGLDEWSEQSGITLLKKNYALESLHTFLKFSLKSTEEIYSDQILQSFHYLPQEMQICHMKFIKDKLLQLKWIAHEDFNDTQLNLISALKKLDFIQYGKDGSVLRASHFFSPFEPVFKAMIPNGPYPPEPYCGTQWRSFMECLGMRSTQYITTDKFVEFARQVEQAGDIKFIVPYTVQKRYTDIYPQKDKASNLIAFSGSVKKKFEKLVWTTCCIVLPECDPSYRIRSKYLPKVQEKLGILDEPCLDSVISHIQNVCDELKTLLDNHTRTTPKLGDILECFYEHLQTNLGGARDLIRRRLQHTPIIFVPDDDCLLPAHQAVQHLTAGQEIKPYLFKAPDQYGKYFQLFECLGTEKDATANHFATVLSVLHQETSGDILGPNELVCMQTAVKNLFKTLDITKLKSQLVVDKLFLPSEEGKLVLSTELIFADNTDFKSRISSQEELIYFADFKKLEIDISDPVTEITKIPKDHRPTMLSSIIKERMIAQSEDVIESDNTNILEDFIHTPEFFNAIIRLIHHWECQELRQGDKTSPEEHQELVWNSLQSIKIQAVSAIESELLVQNVPVPASRRRRKYLVSEGSEGIKEYVLYVSETDERNLTKWLSSVRSGLIRLLSLCLGKSQIYRYDIINALTDILTLYIEAPDGISHYLDEEGIRQYSSIYLTGSLFPPLGTVVPSVFHHLLENSFCEFSVGEYVALELFDNYIDESSEDTKDLDIHYIYAQVVTKIEMSENSGYLAKLLQKYKVNIGAEVIEVTALVIYKFHRKKKSDSRELVLTEICPTPKLNFPQDHVKSEIEKILMESINLPKDQRQRIIKRLYLLWHPDKNPENKELCTEVFHYIQNILSKLKSGEENYKVFSDNIIHRSNSSTPHGGTCSNASLFNRDGRNYRSCDLFEHYCQEPQPNVYESRRWMKQAKSDLKAARTWLDVNPCAPSYNWPCYMCHQSAEKSFKAAWFNQDSRKVSKNHHLDSVARGLGQDVESLAVKLENLVGPHTKMRYPDTSGIPSENFTKDTAEKAYEIAEDILACLSSSHM
ncbi:hypothetical protein ScPMuIL_017695 [Solemya velum]